MIFFFGTNKICAGRCRLTSTYTNYNKKSLRFLVVLSPRVSIRALYMVLSYNNASSSYTNEIWIPYDARKFLNSVAVNIICSFPNRPLSSWLLTVKLRYTVLLSIWTRVRIDASCIRSSLFLVKRTIIIILKHSAQMWRLLYTVSVFYQYYWIAWNVTWIVNIPQRGWHSQLFVSRVRYKVEDLYCWPVSSVPWLKAVACSPLSTDDRILSIPVKIIRSTW